VHTAHDFNLLCVETTMTRAGLACGGRCAKCALQRRVRGGAAAASIDRFIAPSRYLLDRHLAAGVARAGASDVIRPGVPAATARPREAAAAGPVVGFIGTLGEHKGVPTLLDAAGGHKLVVAGTGPLEERVRAATGVEYRGYVSGTDKDDFFDSLDLLVVPSECEENAPLVLAEAAVRGLPAVVSDRGGLPEAPEAEVFPAGDARALAGALDALAARLPEASRRLIARRSEFLWQGHLESVEEVLQNAAGAPRTAVVGDGTPASA
jgi:glycosyltransferase involved in cell wall biosynthesis